MKGKQNRGSLENPGFVCLAILAVGGAMLPNGARVNILLRGALRSHGFPAFSGGSQVRLVLAARRLESRLQGCRSQVFQLLSLSASVVLQKRERRG